MNQLIVKKTASEKALVKVTKKNHNKELLGLVAKSFEDLPTLLKLADAIELQNS
jgi:hypothetical protein